MVGKFQEQIAQDNALVFLNIDEFGETHTVEGKEITIIIDDDALVTRKGGAELGIAESSMLIFARSEDLPKKKAPGSALNIDGRECIVDDWVESSGMSQISLSQNRTI